MRNVVLYLALAVAAFAAPTQAQVFKCAGPAGNPTYSDRPCDQGRGMVLMQHCQAQLSDAEGQIRILENGELKDVDRALKEMP